MLCCKQSDIPLLLFVGVLETTPEPVLQPGPHGCARVGTPASRSAPEAMPAGDERPGSDHHHHEPEDTDRYPEQRQTLRKDRTADQNHQPDDEHHPGDESSVAPY